MEFPKRIGDMKKAAPEERLNLGWDVSAMMVTV
jgi:hypothetical protein